MTDKVQPLLNFEEVSSTLEAIVSNKKLVKIDLGKKKIFVIFSYPSVEDRVLIDFKRQEALEEAIFQELPRLDVLLKRLESTTLLSADDLSKVKKLEEQLAGQQRLLQITKIEGRRLPIKENISRLEKEIQEFSKKKLYMNYLSADNKAEEVVLFYSCWLCTYSTSGIRFWPEFEDFENETDLHKRNQILISFLDFNRGLPMKTARFLARSNLWRTRYTSAIKLGGKLFNRELYDLTPDQLALLYWSNFYQSIFEMLPSDRPDDETISDDEALDKHMELYFKQREAERNEGRVKRGGFANKGKLSAWEKSQELIITPNHSAYFDMQYSDKKVNAQQGVTDVQLNAVGGKRARGAFRSLSQK